MKTDLEWIVQRLEAYLQDDTTALVHIKELVSDVKADLGAK